MDHLFERGVSALHAVLRVQVTRGYVPGAVALVAQHGVVRSCAVGRMSFDGPGADRPFDVNTICRLGSMTKPIISACAMTLVDDHTIDLDEPVDRFLPELADMRVLVAIDAPLSHTVAARRSVTLRDLLTYTLGTGMVFAEPGAVPIVDALDSLHAAQGLGYDTWIQELGTLPLVDQPGERWMYHTAADITGVLIARATGSSLEHAITDRVCRPLGMVDTTFTVRADQLDRFSTAYAYDETLCSLTIDDFSHGSFLTEPAFASGGGGLVSTAVDFLAFASALLGGGSLNGARILSPESVALITKDHLTDAQKSASGFWPGYFDHIGWGFGMSVRTHQPGFGPSVGSYGWPGYFGTAWYNDPVNNLVAIVMMQRSHAGDQRLSMWTDIWATLYEH
jgi:CubicO group peptidase (beta-lactamase class C family)